VIILVEKYILSWVVSCDEQTSFLYKIFFFYKKEKGQGHLPVVTVLVVLAINCSQGSLITWQIAPHRIVFPRPLGARLATPCTGRFRATDASSCTLARPTAPTITIGWRAPLFRATATWSRVASLRAGQHCALGFLTSCCNGQRQASASAPALPRATAGHPVRASGSPPDPDYAMSRARRAGSDGTCSTMPMSYITAGGRRVHACMPPARHAWPGRPPQTPPLVAAAPGFVTVAY